jgi:hypothetical protein
MGETIPKLEPILAGVKSNPLPSLRKSNGGMGRTSDAVTG